VSVDTNTSSLSEIGTLAAGLVPVRVLLCGLGTRPAYCNVSLFSSSGGMEGENEVRRRDGGRERGKKEGGGEILEDTARHHYYRDRYISRPMR